MDPGCISRYPYMFFAGVQRADDLLGKELYVSLKTKMGKTVPICGVVVSWCCDAKLSGVRTG
jgi:hypothetical protein